MKLLRCISILILITTFNFSLNAQLTADFLCSDSVGCGDLFVNFSNKTTGAGNISYYWDFGNGNFSTEKEPTSYYSTSGIYTVKLVVSNDLLEKDSVIKINYIRIHNSPKVNIATNDDVLGCMPLSIKFQPQIILGDTAIEQAIWDFGDNYSSTDSTPTHSYIKGGVYNVSVLIRDYNGCEDVAFKPSYISVLSPPKPAFNSTGNKFCRDSLTVSFNNQLSGQPNLEFLWDFGDGNTSAEINPHHLYQGFGQYDVMLKVKDEHSCTDSLIKKGYVVLAETNRDININTKIYCRLDTIEIVNNSTGITNYLWDFGDGTTATQATPVKTYSESGDFNVTIITSFHGSCIDTLFELVKVDPVRAAYNTSRKYICQLPYNVNYIDESVNAKSWMWKFGNGNISSAQNPTNLMESTPYLKENFVEYYTDTLIVTSDNSCIDTLIVDSSVYVYLPQLFYTPNDSSQYDSVRTGCAPLTVNFTNYSKATHSTDNIMVYQWGFGDGSIAYGTNASHTYNNIGEYDVMLTTINVSGCFNTKTSTVKVGKPLMADFSYTASDSICGSDQVLFFDKSTETGLANGWRWNFSDGTSAITKDVEHSYLDTGYVDASLEVFYNGCKGVNSKIEKKQITYVKGPAGNFSYKFSCDSSFVYTFKQNILDFDYMKWNFDDGVLDSTIQDVVNHVYDTSNLYYPSLYTINYSNNCDLFLTTSILVRDVEADLDINSNISCLDDTVSLYPYKSRDADYFKWNKKTGRYLWTIDDTTEIITSDTSYFYNFLSSGVHNVKLTIRGANGCYDHRDTTIKIYKPMVNFAMVDSAGCKPFTSKIQNKTLSDTVITNWFWKFSDGGTDTVVEPDYIFTSNGTYDVTLMAFDALGCSDTITQEGAVIASKPIPNFTVDRSMSCLFDSVQFINKSEGIKIIADWDFGDGNKSSLFSPKHAYSDTGLQTVTVYLIDSLGCDSTITLTDIVDVKDLPIANCTANFYSSSCYPSIISFADNSQVSSIKKWNWNFGDESERSSGENPLHTYSKPGLYDITLIVTDINNCKDTIRKDNMIEVGGPYADILIDDTICKGIGTDIGLINTINISNAQWLFSDGSTSNEQSLNKVFYDFGINRILLNLMSDNINTCNKTFSDSAFISELISKYVVSDTNGCVPLTIEFSNNSIGDEKINWFFGDDNYDTLQIAQNTYTKSGVFYPKLVVNNEFGCKDSSNVRIEVFPLPEIDISNDTLICEGDTINIFASGGQVYKWSPDENINNVFSPHIKVYPSMTETYAVEVTSDNYCVDSSKIIVEVQNTPMSKVFNNDTILIVGSEIELNANQQGGEQFYWMSGKNIICAGCFDTYETPLEKTTYYFVVKDRNECFEIYDSVNVTIDYKYSVDMPNVFTPNNDGVNDIVKVQGWGIKEVLEFSVYNSNNKLVFMTNDKNLGWNGTEKNQELPQGVYYYYVKVLGYDNVVREIKGSIFLMK